MAKRICLLTGNETKCTDGCYRCGCGGEVALNDCYVPIYNIQRVCDIVKNMADVSTEGEEIAEYIRNELEKMVIPAADVQPVNRWISIEESKPKDMQQVLAAVDGDVREAFYNAGCFIGSNFYRSINEVKWWQPLPKPPKDGEHND